MRSLVQNDSMFEQVQDNRLEGVIQSIEFGADSQKDWDSAKIPSQTLLYILRSAHNVGVSQPFTEEQKALNTYLMERLAGRRLCDYAWRLLAQSL